MPRATSPTLWKTVIFVLIAAAVIAVGVAVGVAQGGSDAASSELDNIANRGQDDAVVALVNGEPILRRAVDVLTAYSLLGGVSDSSGRPIDAKDKKAVLQVLIDEVVLVQAAKAAGASATEDEVTQTIKAGLVDPLADPHTPKDVVAVVRKALVAAGTNLDDLVNDPGLRDAYRRFLLLRRTPDTSPFEVRLAEARAKAQIQVFEDVLNAPR